MPNTPKQHLADQFIRDFDKLADLVSRRDNGEKGLEREIAQLKQAMNIKEAIIWGMND